MFLRRFTDFILQSRLSAMLVAFLIAFIPLIGTMSIIIAALVTLRRGILEGALVAVAATLPYVLSYLAFPPSTETEMAVIAIVILIVSNALTWVFAGFLRHYQNWNITLEVAALCGIIAVLAAHILYPDIQNWWQTHLTAYVEKTPDMLEASDIDPAAAKAELVGMMKKYATGFAAASIILNALLQLLVARWWQAVIFNPGGLRRELHQIRLSLISGVVFILGVALSYLGNATVIDMMPVLLITFFVAGLSLLHYVVSPAQFGWVILALIYLAIIYTFPASVVVVALIALTDTAANIRQRINRGR